MWPKQEALACQPGLRRPTSARGARRSWAALAAKQRAPRLMQGPPPRPAASSAWPRRLREAGAEAAGVLLPNWSQYMGFLGRLQRPCLHWACSTQGNNEQGAALRASFDGVGVLKYVQMFPIMHVDHLGCKQPIWVCRFLGALPLIWACSGQGRAWKHSAEEYHATVVMITTSTMHS